MKAKHIAYTTTAASLIAAITLPLFADLESGKANVKVTASQNASKEITIAEVNAAQQAWCDALVAIGKTHEQGGDVKAHALQVLTKAYNYDQGKVFFKPTLAFGENTFRPTKEGALSYFVGGNPDFPEDMGFALRPWVSASYDNLGENDNGIQIHGDTAIAMGKVCVVAKDGTVVNVEKTFVFKKCDDGKLRLITHMSALPFAPPAK
jgi:hypothetical protein